MKTLPAECVSDLEARNRVIAKANAEIDALGSFFGGAREMAQGVEITIIRPSWKKGHVTRSFRIIPWE